MVWWYWWTMESFINRRSHLPREKRYANTVSSAFSTWILENPTDDMENLISWKIRQKRCHVNSAKMNFIEILITKVKIGNSLLQWNFNILKNLSNLFQETFINAFCDTFSLKTFSYWCYQSIEILRLMLPTISKTDQNSGLKSDSFLFFSKCAPVDGFGFNIRVTDKSFYWLLANRKYCTVIQDIISVFQAHISKTFHRFYLT